MIRLLRVELTRLRWRRAVLVLVALAIVLPALIFAVTAWHTRPVSETEFEGAVQSPQASREIASCQRHPERYDVPATDCETTVRGYYVSRPSLNPGTELRSGVMVQAVTLVALLMLLVGTTFAGHDWNSGSMSNQLLFDPRRPRVWSAKALAVGLVAAVVSALVLLALWLGLLGLAHHRGVSHRPGLPADGFEQIGRSVALTTGIALGAYALTMLLRSTVGTLGVAFGVSVVGSLLIAAVGGDGSTRWQPSSNVGAFITNHLSYYADSGSCAFGPGGCAGQRILTAGPAATYLGVILAVVVLASLWSYSRRDVP